MSQDYHLIEQVKADGDIPVSLFHNRITGLRVAIVHAESPIVYGDLCFATEAFDDDGLPHTLEHLIFLGSEDYPYKGLLDLLANRCYSSGTNAYTDTDHTNYTVSTAGSDGFLTLLPVYLDNVLYPTLTDSGYATEVHHINGDGEDVGVVYCEMQACENTGESRCHLEMLRSLYPGRCGYKSETGGLLENLRTSTNNTKVRNYHKQFYHAKNLCVVVTGPVEPQEIFDAIRPIEDKIVKKGDHHLKFERPWQTPVAPLETSVVRRIQYGSDTDDDGLVYVGFRGPEASTNYQELFAVTIALEYLNSTSISPIQRDFVECDEPYCSSVSNSVIENSTSIFYFAFESVGKDYLDKVLIKLNDLLRNIVDRVEKLDMKRMHAIISRKIIQILSAAETSPHNVAIGGIIGHFLYGNGSLKQRVQEIPSLKEFLNYSEENWLDLITKYMTGPESRYVCIVGEPSPTLMKSMSDSEKDRLAKQRESLRDRLPDLAEKLRLAVEENERPIPDSLWKSFSQPSTDKIKFHSIERNVLEHDKAPFRIQYDSIKTNFVTVSLLMDTSHSLTKSERLYLPLISEMLLECPIDRDGVLVPYETIVAELFEDTVAHDVGVGISSSSVNSVGAISMLFSVSMQVEVEKYEKAVQWFHEILFKTVFTPERIKTVAKKLVSDISQDKRSGSRVVSAAISPMIYQSNSNQWAVNFMRQHKFLTQLLRSLKSEPDLVQKTVTHIRDLICQPKNILVHIALNKDKLDVGQITEPWLKVIPADVLAANPKQQIDLSSITPCHQLANLIEEPKTAIIGVGSVESNYMLQVVKSINSQTDPDLPAVYVLLEYLTQLEGPLWRQLRGTGLTYSYSIQLSPANGLMYLSLFKSTQLVAAYEKTFEIVNKHLSGQVDFDDDLLQSGISCLIYKLIKREKSTADKSLQSLISYIENVDIDINKKLIKQIENVTKDDLRRVGPKYLKPLFEDTKRRAAICCHPSKLDAIEEGVRKLGCEPRRVSLEEEPFLNSLE